MRAAARRLVAADLLDQQADGAAREKAEGVRVAYVAATRARDLLVVPAVGDEPYDGGWVSPLNAQSIRRRRSAAARRRRADARRSSRDSVRNGRTANRPPAAPSARACIVGDGDGEHAVVWWSPEREALTLDVEASFGLRRDDLIVKDVPSSV